MFYLSQARRLFPLPGRAGVSQGRRLRSAPFLLFASQFMKRAEVFFWQPHFVVATERPPNVASQTTF